MVPGLRTVMMSKAFFILLPFIASAAAAPAEIAGNNVIKNDLLVERNSAVKLHSLTPPLHPIWKLFYCSYLTRSHTLKHNNIVIALSLSLYLSISTYSVSITCILESLCCVLHIFSMYRVFMYVSLYFEFQVQLTI
jgi:hypothetical protein